MQIHMSQIGFWQLSFIFKISVLFFCDNDDDDDDDVFFPF